MVKRVQSTVSNVIIRYKGTDAVGIFRIGVTKVPDDAAVQAWRAERADWRELTVTVEPSR